MYAPVQEARSLVVAWQLPPFQLNRTVEPLSFVSQLLGNAGVGSLQAWLRARGWALSVGAFSEEETDDWAVYMVSVDLTELGFEHVDEVTAALFEYIGVLRAEANWVPLWNETRSLADIDVSLQGQGAPVRLRHRHHRQHARLCAAGRAARPRGAERDQRQRDPQPRSQAACSTRSQSTGVQRVCRRARLRHAQAEPPRALVRHRLHARGAQRHAGAAVAAALLTQTGNNTNFAIPQRIRTFRPTSTC
jgi:hypothetical protein